MKKFLFITLALFTLSALLFSCEKEIIEDSIENNAIATARANEAVSTILFIASMRRGGNCFWDAGLCNGEGCDIKWNGDISGGIKFINEMEDADAIFNIETYEEKEIIGFRFKDFSSSFKAKSKDESSIFNIAETMLLNEEATKALGHREITLYKGDYKFFLDKKTKEKMVYIKASLK